MISLPPAMETVQFTAIAFDAPTQIRVANDTTKIATYREQMAEGDIFPPADLFHDGERFYIGDGWHRLLAAKAAGWPGFQCVVHQGSIDEALKFAMGANGKHGDRFTNKDKRHAVEIAVQRWGTLSDREIAKICGVSNAFVSRTRNVQLCTVHSSRPATVGADGKTRKAPVTAPIPAAPPAPPADQTPAVAPRVQALPPSAPPQPAAWQFTPAAKRLLKEVDRALAECPAAELVAFKAKILDGVGKRCAVVEVDDPSQPFGNRKKVPPTAEQVTAYSMSIGYPMDGKKWCDVHESKGWMIGKARMKDWQAAVRTWKAQGHGSGTIALAAARRPEKPVDYSKF